MRAAGRLVNFHNRVMNVNGGKKLWKRRKLME